MKFIRNIIILALLLLSIVQVKSQVVFSETFESGALPTGWSNVYESGTVNWTYTTGGNSGHPATAHGGIKNALFFYGSYSGQTTKLMTTVLNLSAVNFPVLKFWHTQDAWVADQDKLKVYYKTSAGGSWNLLAAYDSEINNWIEETIDLPNKSATYYIAFEARTGYGYGVCLDDVSVWETPTTPKSLSSISINQASTEYLLQGSTNNPILRVDLDVAGNSGTLLLNSLEINTLNSDNSFVNPNGVKIFATTTNSFSPANQVGTAQSISSNKAIFTSLNYDLPAGISHLWITYDIAAGTLPDMLFDALIDLNKINIAGSTYPATTQSPPGNRILLKTIFQDDFETDKGWVLTGEFERNTPQGLGGTYQYPDPLNAYSGTNILGTDLTGLGIFPGDYEPSLSSKVYSAKSPNINCSFYTSTKLRFYRWLNIENWDKAYIDISNDSGATWYQIWASTLTMNETSWTFQEVDISSYADRKSGIKIRYSLGTTDGTQNCSGWNIDDVIIIGDFYNPEMSVTSILSPVNGCNHTASDTVKIRVKNSGGLPSNDTLRVCYSFDGGNTMVYDTIFTTVPLGDSLVFTFRQTADLSSPATFNFFAATLAPNDKNPANDTLHKSITASPQFTIPYFTDFESGQSGWYTGGINSSWQYGTPSSPVINHTASGIKAWKTGINSYYNSDEISYLQSPCFDFTGITEPVIEFKLWWISEPDFDGASLIYSTDDAATWHPVGAYGDISNWYNFDTITSLQSGFGSPAGWSYVSNIWIKVKHLLPPVIANNPDVKFRLVFASNNLSVEEGFAIDDIAIYDNQPDLGVTAITSPTSACSLTAAENITVIIRNFGSVIYNIGDTIKAGLTINGSQISIDSIILTTPFFPGTTLDHTFAIACDLHIPGNYIIDSYTMLSGDLNVSNNSFTSTVSNYGFPTVTIQNLQPAYCNDASNIVLTGTPAGGIFSGSGISGATFSPSSLLPGAYNIIYSYADIHSCSGTDTVNTIINPVPLVSFTGLNTTYCVNSSNAILTGIPSGGIFSGAGITGNTFSPSFAGAGTHTITYSYSNAFGCSDSHSENVIINSISPVNFTGLDTVYCTNVSDVILIGSPAGGTFSGQGISGNNFSPQTAGSGNHLITYSYTDINLCSNSITKNVLIYNSPVVNFTGLDSIYCINAPVVTLTGNPSGGIFSGPGITGNNFSASNAGTGIHNISYLYTDNNSCSDLVIKKTTVVDLPVVNIIGLDTSYCLNSSSATLTGSPSGGTFSGFGISGNVFTPANANTGNHIINYIYTDANSCTNSISKTVSVHALPVINLSGLDAAYCINALSATLTGSPSGGIFSGPGITGNIFSPSSAGTGTHTIIYTFTDNNNCSNTDSKNVSVVNLPVVNFTGLDISYCLNASSATLTGSPSGGSFSGTGITGNVFSPSSAGTGTHTISYQFTDNNNCSDISIKNVTVYALPVINFTGLNSAYCIDSSGTTLTGTPSGGTFSGTGLTGNIFNPANSGAGTFNISYFYTDINSCSNSVSQNTTVYVHPIVSFNGLDTAYCENHTTITLFGSPAGGTFTGQGISGNTFNPFIATPGIHQIIYTYILQSVCASIDTQFVIIREAPVTSFSGLDTAYCLNDSPVTLLGIPAGGFFSGEGINGTIFNPSSTTSANINITYTFINGYGCENQTLHSTSVFNTSSLSINGLNNSYCINSSPAMLTGTPPGGVFTGNGMTGNNFNPAIVPIGTDTIYYSVTDINGCTVSNFQITQIYNIPVVTINGLDTSYCFNSPLSVLLGIPTGGAFSGGNISGNIFTPNIAGAGPQQIIYSFTDLQGCTNKDTATSFVYPFIAVSLTISDSVFCKNDQPITLFGTPASGNFYGYGVTGNIFKPELTTASNFYISYYFSDGYGCNYGDSTAISVSASPVFSFPADTLKGTFPFIINAGSGYTSYLWETGSTQQMITVDLPAWYSVTVTNASGCSASDSVYIAKLIGIDELDSKTKISIFPNPAHHKTSICIESENPTYIKIELINNVGVTLYKKELYPAAKINESIDITKLAKGAYYFKIIKEEMFIFKKFIIF